MFSVEYSSNAVKTLQKLDPNIAAMIYGWIDKNLVGCDNPRMHGKALVGDMKGYWRYRVGSYRLIADIQDYILRIEIISIGHRREVYGG